MKNKIKYIVFLLLIFFIISCSCGKNYDIIVKNPTEYVFSVNIDSIKTIIKKKFSRKQFYGLELSYKEYDFSAGIFNKTENYNDFMLMELGVIWPKSKVYFNRKNVPHNYFANYHLHLMSINENQTMVQIITTESGIMYKSIIPVFPHFSPYRIKKLPPTTVEEYEILRIIGKSLGIDRNMPPIIMPEKIIINKRVCD